MAESWCSCSLDSRRLGSREIVAHKVVERLRRWSLNGSILAMVGEIANDMKVRAHILVL